MRKKLPKILMIFFIAIFVLQLIALIFLFLSPNEAGAVEFTPQVEIPGAPQGAVSASTATIAEYIKAIYQYGVGIVGILSAIVLMFGGLLWLTAGGESGRVTEAKEWIKSALLGLILSLLSYVILLTINPDLVNFQPITVEQIKSNSSNDSKSVTDAPDKSASQKVLEITEATVPINTDCNNYYQDKIVQYMELAKNGRKITVKVDESDPGNLLNGSQVKEGGGRTAPTKKNCVFSAVENATK